MSLCSDINCPIKLDLRAETAAKALAGRLGYAALTGTIPALRFGSLPLSRVLAEPCAAGKAAGGTDQRTQYAWQPCVTSSLSGSCITD